MPSYTVVVLAATPPPTPLYTVNVTAPNPQAAAVEAGKVAQSLLNEAKHVRGRQSLE